LTVEAPAHIASDGILGAVAGLVGIEGGIVSEVFGGDAGKDTVSRTWRNVKSDWDDWNAARSPTRRSCA
jgi:hypothetical protein